MTLDLMPASTRAAFAALPDKAKQDVLALVHNKYQVVMWRLERASRGQSEDPGEDARIALNESRTFLRDLKQLLKPEPNSHLGSIGE